MTTENQDKKENSRDRRLETICVRKVCAKGKRGRTIVPPTDFAVNVGDDVIWYKDLDTGDLVLRPRISE